MRCPAAAYPFLMQLLLEHREGNVEDQEFADLMNAVESFLVRRLICGYEPTGLHALFKSLWEEMGADRSVSNLQQIVSQRGTIHWPDQDMVKKAIEERPLYNSKVCRFILVELDRLYPGDDPSETPTIEHILPQKREEGSQWAELFSEQEHQRYRHTLANLVPLSGELNSSIQNQPYMDKVQRYRSESMFKTPRRLAETFPEVWGPDQLASRSQELAGEVLDRWCV